MHAPTLPLKPPTRRLTSAWFGALLAAPTIAVVVTVLVFPLLDSLWVSFRATDIYSNRSTFVGLDNYQAVLSDPLFSLSLRNTLYFAAVSVLGITVVGLCMALVLNEPSHLQSAGRTALIIPWCLSQVVAGIMWGWIYNGTFGALNGVLMQLGVIREYQSWFTGGLSSFNFISIAFIWSVCPYAALLFLATLQSIPEEIYQAAKVDGAHAWGRFRHVTLPLLRSTFLVVLVIATLDGFLAFTLIYVLTNGGPGNSTTVLAWWGYATTFTFNDLGRGAAILYLLSAMLLVVSAGYIRYFARSGVGEV